MSKPGPRFLFVLHIAVAATACIEPDFATEAPYFCAHDRDCLQSAGYFCDLAQSTCVRRLDDSPIGHDATVGVDARLRTDEGVARPADSTLDAREPLADVAITPRPDARTPIDPRQQSDASVAEPRWANGGIGGRCVSQSDCDNGYCETTDEVRAMLQIGGVPDPTRVEVPDGYCVAGCDLSGNCSEAAAVCAELYLPPCRLRAIGLVACMRACDPADAATCRSDQTCHCATQRCVLEQSTQEPACVCLPDSLAQLYAEDG